MTYRLKNINLVALGWLIFRIFAKKFVTYHIRECWKFRDREKCRDRKKKLD